MRNTTLRVVLVLVALAAACGAGYYVFTLEQRAAALRETRRVFDEEAARLQVALADLRASQAAYLASTQDTSAWAERAGQLLSDANGRLQRLRAAAGSPEVDGELAVVAESLGALGRFDREVRTAVAEGRISAASGFVFSDMAELSRTASTSLAGSRGTRAERTEGELAGVRQYELYAAGGACTVAVLVLLLLAPVPRPKHDEQDAPADDVSAPGGVARTFGDLELAPRVPPAEQAAATAGAPAAAPVPAVTSRPPVDLAAAASLCTDLARVQDTSELQGLLARAASLLDASGIVVWMGGVQGDHLWPAFSHGYSPQALARMQALPRDGSTPVSVAFRKGGLEVVPVGDEHNGAIVAPILTSAGCVGAMAVEVRHGAEMQSAEQALAIIIAAQLATLVAGDPTP